MKDHLTTREVDFVSINVVENTEALDDLRDLGVMALPVVARGDNYAIGLDMEQVFNLVGLNEVPPKPLSARELVDRIDQTVISAVRFTSQLPTDQYEQTIPGRDRTYLGLANHIINHVEIFMSLAGGSPFTLEDVDEEVLRGLEKQIDSPAVLGSRGQAATTELRDWLADLNEAELGRIVPTFFGDQTLHSLLATCAYSVTQHTRQLMTVLEMLDIAPDHPLTEADYTGLQMPTGVWE